MILLMNMPCQSFPDPNSLSPRDFNPLNFNVYNKMKGDIMKSSKSDLELLLDHYRVSKCVAITFP